MCNVVRINGERVRRVLMDGEADPYRRARTRLSSAVRDMMRRCGRQWV